MLKLYTVCGNGIGSSLMAKTRVEQICDEMGIKATVESTDFNSAQSKDADLIITVKELAGQFSNRRVAVIDSYINKEKIRSNIKDILLELAQSQ